MSDARAQRVRALADEALARADAARADLENLLGAVERLRAALREPVAEDPTPSEPPRATLDDARLVAIEMAVAGRDRAEVERHLHATYGGPDVAELLDDVFGAAPLGAGKPVA